ncbi:MAG TPA: histidine triad nucleotide-binding protein [Candidatus Limnocylindria bacterium]|nr:histidine triad nucleotide-binding protein [Candidatus Limnocylindria bacterium]
MEDCAFCRIVAKQIPSDIVYEDPDVVAFADANPVAPFHVLVVPKAHIPNLASVANDPLGGKLLAACAIVARDGGYTERGYRVVANTGRDAGQTVIHLHLHVIAGRQLAWPPG